MRVKVIRESSADNFETALNRIYNGRNLVIDIKYSISDRGYVAIVTLED